MRSLMIFPVLLAAAASAGATQQQPAPTPEPAKPITQREPNAVDVVTTPATDLNLRKGEIPPVLLAAEADPYSLSAMRNCRQIADAVRQLDAVLGDDIDIAQAPNRKVSPGKVAQSVVGSFIPFRGIIREISGANEQERRLQSAIYGGTARRSFLRGVGLQRGCPWPARPATPEMLARVADQNAAKAQPAGQPRSGQRRR